MTLPHVAPVGEVFEVSPEAAAKLWAHGKAIPYIAGDTDTVRSADGDWMVRRLGLEGAAEHYEDTEAELNRLRELGIHLISYATAITPEDNTFFRLSPWLPTIQPCPKDLYFDKVFPAINTYWQEKVARLSAEPNRPLNFLLDVDAHQQYSVLPEAPDEPFMHDSKFSVDSTASALNDFQDVVKSVHAQAALRR